MNEQTEKAARRAYDTWRRRYDHVTRWNELSPGAQVLWLNIAQAVESVRTDELDLYDWADVRETARKAGWRISRDTHTVETYWNARRLDQDGHPDPGLGWVDIGVHDGHCRANLVSPGHPKDSVVLSDPTPARVLEAARLVGLDGGTP